MLKGVADNVTKFINKSILSNKNFIDRFTLDHVVGNVQDFEVTPFESDWTRKRKCVNVCDKLYIPLYEKNEERYSSSVLNITTRK